MSKANMTKPNQAAKRSVRILLLCTLLGMLILAVVLSPEMQRRSKARSEEQTSDGEELASIAPGEFRMGSPKSEEDAARDEAPARMVRISKGFWLGKYEVTQEQYERVMGSNPSFFRGSERPVEQVSWDDAVEFCAKLTSSNSGSAYRLPTEAEWEYACRAGAKTRFNTGDSNADLARAGWYYENSGLMTHSVGEKEANAWGVHDTHGNVWEWCSDWYSPGYYGTRPFRDGDPTGPSSGSFRVGRGGSWEDEAHYCRSAYRENGKPSYRSYYVGFRLAAETQSEGGAIGEVRTFDGIEFVWIPPGEFRMGSEQTFDGIEFVWIPAGEFSMGSPSSEKGRYDDEGPVHTVRITKGFWLGKFEVTQEQYERVMGNNPSHFKGSNRPVENVSWEDAVEFCRKLSRSGDTTYRLPTEAEWEYACRAGTTTRFYTGDSDSDLGRAGWYGGNSGSQTHDVGQRTPNVWNLYDIHGNVWEWCSDWYDKDYYGWSANPDPTGPGSGSNRVERGGSWGDNAQSCRSAFRNIAGPGNRDCDLGFRLAAETQKGKGALGEEGTSDGTESIQRRPGDLATGSSRSDEPADAKVGRSAAAKSASHRLGEGRTFDGIEFVWIPAGEFPMGSPSSESRRDDDEGPVHRVRITRGFWMGKFEVTQEQYERVMGRNPSRFKATHRPVENVSWEDAVHFCRKLSESEHATYRLPTEAEWEYACRAGTTTRFYTGNSDSDLGRAGWYGSYSGDQTHDVGQKVPNAWNLYDTHGNVWEWCSDWYGKGYYSGSAASDPSGPSNGSYRVLRGGSWYYGALYCRSASRRRNDPVRRCGDFGFRLVRSE